LAINYTQVLL